MALVATQVSEVYDFHSERFARSLWVNGAPILPYVEVRAAKLEAYLRQAATAAKKRGGGLPPPLAQFLNLPGPSGMGSAH